MVMAAGLSEIPVAATGGSTAFAASCVTRMWRVMGVRLPIRLLDETTAIVAPRFLVLVLGVTSTTILPVLTSVVSFIQLAEAALALVSQP